MMYKIAFCILLMTGTSICTFDSWHPRICNCILDEPIIVCGSDGRDYKSHCELRCRDDYTKHKLGTRVELSRSGSCDEEDSDIPNPIIRPIEFSYDGSRVDYYPIDSY